MKVLINDVMYDSTKVPVRIDFDENEQEMFNGMKRFVSAPEDSTIEERQELMDRDIHDSSFDSVAKDELKEMYIILSKTQPEIADFTFYTDLETVNNRVKELNKLAKSEEYWYITMYSNSRNSGKFGEGCERLADSKI